MTDDPHAYFSAEPTMIGVPRPGKRIGVYFGDAPEDLPTGGKRLFMRFPVLIVSSATANQDEFAKLVAEVLSENAHRFSAQARTIRDQKIAAVYGDGDGPGAA